MDRFSSILREKKRHYIPEDFDFFDKDSVIAVVTELENRSLDSREAVSQWVRDEGEFGAAIGESGPSAYDSADAFIQWMKDEEEFLAALGEAASIAYIEYTCATDDPEKEKRKEYFDQELMPALAPQFHALNLKYWNCPHRKSLDQKFWALHNKSIETSIRLFREENIPLEAELAKLSGDYQKMIGVMTVMWDGEEKTIPQMAVFMDDPARDVRERAWRLVNDRRRRDAEALDDIFERMLALRNRIAKNAGFANYRDYMFVAKERWDYGPGDCETFSAAVRDCVMPLTRALQKRRREKLGLPALRPWDGGVDEDGKEPLKPFKTANELRDKVMRMYRQIDPRLAEMFSILVSNNLLDLDSRKGKAPGGYQTVLDERKLPFIFMNAAGTSDDVITLLHEGGHSFHTLQTKDMEWDIYKHAGAEFAEVASMSMELLGAKYFAEFYSPEDASRAWGELLERMIWLFGWVAQVDAFQHWIYTNPDQTRAERHAKWVELSRTYSGDVDYSGLEEAERTYWHRQLHIFELPFYYIEYAIAQLGALQVWRNSLVNEREAVEKYLGALALGGSRPLPELFAAAGTNFGFSQNEIGPLIAIVAEKLGIRIEKS